MRARQLLLVAMSALLLAACGDQAPAKGPLGSADNPLPALPNPQATRTPPTSEAAVAKPKAAAKTAAERRSSIVAAQQRTQARNEAKGKGNGKGTGARTADGVSQARGKLRPVARSARRPCSLVTRSQAAAIIGAPILEPLEAPQGPTCIYQTASRKRAITLTVQSTSFARLRAQISNRRKIAVADREAVCGRYGQPMLYLPLGGRRVLTVSGPCATASRFAAKAVPHL